ncbi:fucolectin-3-like [Asterias amurensis]|uniref:fucolectin-3-like n=1 Tax=Asterias amurensis TaxID=7602 RepID=UPI003AB3B113
MQSLPGAMIAFTCEPPVLATYISVDIDPSRQDVTDAVLHIAEVTVELVGSSTAFSLGGSHAYQSSTFGFYNSSEAVDGNLGSHFHSATNDPHPWWQVDFGENHCMGKITVSLRRNCCGENRFRAAVVRAGLSPDFIQNQQCGLPATESQSTDGAVVEFLCEPPVIARYVSLDIDPSRPDVTLAILQIAEVNVQEYTSQECAGIAAPKTAKRGTRKEMTCYVI